MLQYSEKLKSFENINILEPTAGIGNIPMYILQNYKRLQNLYGRNTRRK